MNAGKFSAAQSAVARERDAEKDRYIVIVDDEPRIVRSLTRELSAWAKERELTITGMLLGSQAVEFIGDHRDAVEIVIADMRMPGMSGGDMVREIKRLRPFIKVIVLTAYDEIKGIERAGIDSFMTKPWDSNQLIRELERLLE